MGRLRILCVGNLYPPAGMGGYERVWADGVTALRGAGHQVGVLTTAPVSGAELPEGPRLEGDVARTLRWYWRDFGWLQPSVRAMAALERHNRGMLARELRAFQPDVVSWWGMGGMSLSLIEQVRRAGIPAVGLVADGWMVYGFDVDAWMRRWGGRPQAPPLGRLRRFARPLFERGCRVPTSIALGDAAEWLFISDAVRRRAPSDLARTGLAQPGVDPQRFARAEPPAWWRGRLLYAGRIERVKGVEVAVRALARLDDTTILTIDGSGDPDHVARLRSLAAELRVAERIRWHRSPRDQMRAAYADADCVLFPVTWEEPWGLVPLEAMAVGRPVIATGTGGSAEYLVDGTNALLATPGDERSLADAVQRVAESASLRERLVAGGVETAARYTRAAFEGALVAAHERATLRSRSTFG